MFDLSTSVSDLSADDECIKVPQRQRHIRERVHPMLFYTEFEARFRVSKETVTFWKRESVLFYSHQWAETNRSRILYKFL